MIKFLWEKNSQLAATLPFVFISSDCEPLTVENLGPFWGELYMVLGDSMLAVLLHLAIRGQYTPADSIFPFQLYRTQRGKNQ